MKTKLLSLFVALIVTTALGASNVITYTAKWKLGGHNGSLDVGKATFGSTITSHEFTDGTGIITCDGEITMIEDSAFEWCNEMTSITIPNSVATIGKAAFMCCKNLPSITIPNSVTTIGDYAFAYCDCLTLVTIGNSVTTIGIKAFDGCRFSSITIPNSVTTIGDEAFSFCSLTSVTIPSSVTAIGYGPFDDCGSLTAINVDAGNTHYCSIDGVLFDYAKDTLIQYPIGNTQTTYTIPNSVTTIGIEAFDAGHNLTSVTIPNSVTTIKEAAFDGCGFSSVTIPNSVTTIEKWAFGECSKLTSITIPNSVTTIANKAFDYCRSLTAINVDAGNTHYCSIDGVLFDYAKDTLIQYPMGNTQTTYTIPNSVSTIDYSAFSYCSNLTLVTIPNSVKMIVREAFSYCTNLDSVSIPNSVTMIGKKAFHKCTKLRSATIGNSVTMIGDSAFSNCGHLTSVIIGNSVTWIGSAAFEYCSGLKSITCYASIPPTCDNGSFYGVDKSIPVYVPAGSVEAYKSSKQWKDFYNIHPITAQEVEVTEVEAEPTESTVEIAWPIVVDAETYTIEIRLGDQLICSIIFNTQGQLLSINFNPAPSRGHTYAKTAEGTATGWAYTIAGLNPGTNYTYSVVAKDATDQVIDTKNGLFTTTAPTGLLDVNDNSKFLIQNSKLIKNGHLYILRDNNLYNATGARVK